MSKATTLNQLELHALKSANYTDKKVAELGEAVAKAIEEASPEIVQTTGTNETAVMSQKAVTDALNGISLGIASDGLIYIFVDGTPVGTGIPQGQIADVYGYIDENNHITFTGKNVPDGYYTCSFDMENGSTVPIGAFEKDTNTYYSIASNLTNCTTNNSAKTVVEGESYSATITANDGYELKSVSVTMGGSAVSVSGGVINIASVTGNIVITAVAEEVVAAEPVTVNIGLTKDKSIEMSAGEIRSSASAGHCTTDWIDVTNIPKPCTIHLAEAQWAYSSASQTGYVRCFIKNTSGTKLVGDYTSPSKMPSGVTMVLNNGAEDDVTITVTSDNIGTLRFAGMYTYGNVDNFAETIATLTYTPNS